MLKRSCLPRAGRAFFADQKACPSAEGALAPAFPSSFLLPLLHCVLPALQLAFFRHWLDTEKNGVPARKKQKGDFMRLACTLAISLLAAALAGCVPPEHHHRHPGPGPHMDRPADVHAPRPGIPSRPDVSRPAPPARPEVTRPAAPDRPSVTRPSAPGRTEMTRPAIPDRPAVTRPSAPSARPEITRPAARDRLQPSAKPARPNPEMKRVRP